MKKGDKVRTTHLDENVEGVIVRVIEGVEPPVGDGRTEAIVDLGDGALTLAYDTANLEPA